jgi:hypothetical protein
MKKNKNLKIDTNLDYSDNNNFRNTSLTTRYNSNLKSTPLSVRNNTSRSLKKKFYNINSIEKKDNFRLASIKSIIQNEKQFENYRNNINNSIGLINSELNYYINDVKSPSRSLTDYTPLTIKNKILTPKYKTFDSSLNNVNENIKKEPISTKNSKMPNILSQISITNILCFKHIPLDINILNQIYRDYENSKYSSKSNYLLKTYGVNTYQGIFRYFAFI